MIKPQAARPRHGRGQRGRHLTFALTLLAALCTAPVGAQAPAAPVSAAVAPVAEELETLVGRIALYPDDLIGIILPSSTNPLQIVQADRYLQKRKTDPKAPIDEKWDDAVKSLLNYPDVVKMMSDDLDWTSALGEAVVADAGAVLEAVQDFRRKAQSAGNLKTDDKQKVQVEKEVITIVQANPEVIYVPQYNPTTVVYAGYAGWGYYPTPYPVYYYPYPPGAAFATGLIWGAAIGAAWNGGRYATQYGGNNNINIDRSTDINVGSGNRGDRPSQGGGSSQWKSSKQPGQVSSSVGKTHAQARPGDSRPGGGAQAGAGAARPSTQPSGVGGGDRAGGGGAARPSTQPSGLGGGGDKAGGAGAANRASPSGGSAFSGYDSGRQTSMDSSRGASSRSSMSGGASRPSPSSAGARSGGGGARAGGGGGGGRRR